MDLAHDAPFLVPIVIDDTSEVAARVPDRFRLVQWIRLAGGEPSPEMVMHVKRLVGNPGKTADPFVYPSNVIAKPTAKAPTRTRVVGTPRRWPLILTGAMACCATAAVVFLWVQRPPAAPNGQSAPPTVHAAPALPILSAPGVKTVAVLAFADLSPSKDSEYFADGISEELLNVLAKVPGLHVAARTSAFFFKGRNVPIPEIAQKLGVAYVVEGSVRRSGEYVRITAQLINAATGFHVWSENFDRELKDIFSVQDEIAREIARNLQLSLHHGTDGNKTVNPEAHRLVLEGRHFWNLRNEEGFARAESAFAQAAKIDPQFAEAHAGLAEVCVIRANYRQFDGSGQTAEDLTRARIEGRIAIGLNPRLAEPHAALGYVSLLEGRLADADRQFQTALAINPNSAMVRCWHALLLANRGMLDAALLEYDRASVLDPLWFINLHRHAWHLTRARRFDEAMKINEHAASLLKDIHIPNRADHAVILWHLGFKSEAIQTARLVTQLPDKEPRWQADSDVIWVLRQGGLEREAADYATKVMARLAAANYNRGFILGALGRFDEALPFLEQTVVNSVRGLFWDAMWDPWREDPRFIKLIRKLGREEDYKKARATQAQIIKEWEVRQKRVIADSMSSVAPAR